MYHHALMSRVALIFAAVLALFLAFNIITVWMLLRLHPWRKWIVIAVATIGNVMWIFFPILNARTDFSRLARAIFGPPWFAWLCFVMVYSIVIAVAAVIFRRRLRLISLRRSHTLPSGSLTVEVLVVALPTPL